MKRVLILDGAVYPDLYHPTEHFRAELGDVPSDSVHLPSGQPVADLGRYSHLIVTGSEGSITRPAPWYRREADAIRKAFDAGLPMLGSCFGHQMLAVALSGEQYAVASETPEFGWIPLDALARDHLLQDLPDRFFVFNFHFDEVRDPPVPWRTLARSSGCGVQIMRYGDRPIWGIQAHPEIPPDDARILMEGFSTLNPDRAHLIAPALEAEVRDDRVLGRIMRRFLQSA